MLCKQIVKPAIFGNLRNILTLWETFFLYGKGGIFSKVKVFKVKMRRIKLPAAVCVCYNQILIKAMNVLLYMSHMYVQDIEIDS